MRPPRRFRYRQCPRCGSTRRISSRFEICTPCVVRLEWHRPEVVR